MRACSCHLLMLAVCGCEHTRLGLISRGFLQSFHNPQTPQPAQQGVLQEAGPASQGWMPCIPNKPRVASRPHIAALAYSQ